ncbi:MAG: hypothetical protein IKH63_06490 [Prevotella sp.]|nr:hypothetical protein [Prevotella sp.]
MIEIDEEKLAKLVKGSEHLTEKYGAPGSKSRDEFNARAECYYQAVLVGEDVTDL